MFRVGDKAVYPAHGVGEITAIETRDIMGKPMEVYVMQILDREMTIIIAGGGPAAGHGARRGGPGL